MSIKSKKVETSNTYRLKKIEDYLVSQGYVCDSYIKGILYGTRRWTDCVNNGYDISYSISPPQPSTDKFTPAFDLALDHFFYIGLDSNNDYLFSCSDVKIAVRQSREIPPDLQQ